MTKTRTICSTVDGERKIVEHIWSEMLLEMNRKPKEGSEAKDHDRKFKSGKNIGFDIWVGPKVLLGDWGHMEKNNCRVGMMAFFFKFIQHLWLFLF